MDASEEAQLVVDARKLSEPVRRVVLEHRGVGRSTERYAADKALSALVARIEQLEAENLTLRSSLTWCAGHFEKRDGEIPRHVQAALREDKP
jgi:hypothetical protein